MCIGNNFPAMLIVASEKLEVALLSLFVLFMLDLT
jgi:hypothetical protein